MEKDYLIKIALMLSNKAKFKAEVDAMARDMQSRLGKFSVSKKRGEIFSPFSQFKQGQVYLKQMSKIDKFFKGIVTGAHQASLSLIKWGKNMQWTGRQIEFSIGLPLMLLGGYAVKTFLDIERSATFLRKVFIENAAVVNDVLIPAAEKFSTAWGIAQEEVIDVMSEWGRIGITSGEEIKKLTQTTIEWSKLTRTSMEQSFGYIRTIMLGFQLDAEKTKDVLASIYIIEEKTAAETGGVAQALSKLGAVSRQLRIPVLNLAGWIAGISSSGQSANNAATALNFGLGRLVAATPKAVKAMQAYIKGFGGKEWMKLNVVDMMEIIAKKVKQVGLSSKDSSYETNKFFAAMKEAFGARQAKTMLLALEDMEAGVSQYRKAIEVAKDPLYNMIFWNKALQTILSSPAMTFDQMVQGLRNAAAAIGKLLLPPLIILMNKILELLDVFRQMPDETKKIALAILSFAAVFGTIVRLAGVFAILFGMMQKVYWVGALLVSSVFKPIAKIISSFVMVAVNKGVQGFAALVKGINLANIAAGILKYSVMSIVAIFQVYLLVWLYNAAKAFNTLAQQYHKVAEVIDSGNEKMIKQNAVANKVYTTIKKLAKIFAPLIGVFNELKAYWNVMMEAWGIGALKMGDTESVVISAAKAFAGFVRVLAVVAKSLMIIGTIAGHVARALLNLSPFTRHSPSLVEQVDLGVNMIIAKYKSLSQIVPIMNSLRSNFNIFKGYALPTIAGKERSEAAEGIGQLPKNQQGYYMKILGLIQTLKAKLTLVDNEYMKQSTILEGLNKLVTKYNEAQEMLSFIADASIKGMKQYDDAMWNVEMQTAATRLKLVELELQMKAVGKSGSVEDMRTALMTLQDVLRDNITYLKRYGGAQGTIDKLQSRLLAANQELYGLDQAMQSGASAEALQNQLDRLGLEAEKLELEKKLKFEPLTKQLDDLADTTKEYSFEQLYSEGQKARTTFDSMEQALKNNARQLGIVIPLNKDAAYAAEFQTKKTEELEQAFQSIEREIGYYQGILNDLISKLKEAGGAGGAGALETGMEGIEDATNNAGGALGKFVEDAQSSFDLLSKIWEETKKEYDTNIGGIDWKKPNQDMQSGLANLEQSFGIFSALLTNTGLILLGFVTTVINAAGAVYHAAAGFKNFLAGKFGEAMVSLQIARNLAGNIPSDWSKIYSTVRTIASVAQNPPTLSPGGAVVQSRFESLAARGISTYATGGLINEPVFGIGQRTGRSYTIGEAGPEYVLPMNKMGGKTEINIRTLQVEVKDGSKQSAMELINNLKRIAV